MIDSVGTAEMSKEQLEAHANRLRTEMEREREERNFFQLERDKIQIFWDITRQQLEERLAELRFIFSSRIKFEIAAKFTLILETRTEKWRRLRKTIKMRLKL